MSVLPSGLSFFFRGYNFDMQSRGGCLHNHVFGLQSTCNIFSYVVQSYFLIWINNSWHEIISNSHIDIMGHLYPIFCTIG